MPSQRTAAAAPGSCERCHRSLASEHSGEAGNPVCAANRVAVELARDGARLIRPADVMPRDRRADGLAAAIEQHAGLGHAGDADRCDGPRGGVGERPRGHLVDRLRDHVRIELGPGRHRGPRRPRAGLAQLLPVRVEHERLAIGRADIEAEQQLRHRYPAASTIARSSSMRARPTPLRNSRRSAEGRPTASFHSERPAMNPSAPPSMASRSCPQNAS